MRAVRVVAWSVAIVAILWVVLVVLLWVFQRQLLYLPDRAAPPQPPPPVETVTLTTADGLELAAWFVPATGEAVTTVLVASGNAGNRQLRLPLASGLADRGHAVLLFDYRGYGGNPGSPSEAGLLRDAQAALAHLQGRDDVDPERIAYLGESLGTGVVAQLAADVRPPAGLVLRSPFPDLAQVARTHYPFVPAGWLLADRYETTEVLEGSEIRALVVAGDTDRIIPLEASREVAARLQAPIVELPGVDHNDRDLLDGARYLDAVDRFLRGEVPADATRVAPDGSQGQAG